MGGFCSSDTTSTTTTKPNDKAGKTYKNVLKAANTAANQKFTPYKGEMVAPVNAQQNLGIAGINNAANEYQPYFNQATQYGNTGATPVGRVNASQIQEYMDPYTQQVIDATQRQFRTMNEEQRQDQLGNAAAAGALGGNRIGVQNAQLGRQQQIAQDPIIADLYSKGYSQALGEANIQQQNEQANRDNSLSAGSLFGNLGTNAQSSALSGAKAQIDAGSLQQQTQQAEDQAKYNEFMRKQDYPFKTAQFLAQTSIPAASGLGGTTTSTTPGASGLSQAVGAGTTALGAAGSAGLFNSAATDNDPMSWSTQVKPEGSWTSSWLADGGVARDYPRLPDSDAKIVREFDTKGHWRDPNSPVSSDPVETWGLDEYYRSLDPRTSILDAVIQSIKHRGTPKRADGGPIDNDFYTADKYLTPPPAQLDTTSPLVNMTPQQPQQTTQSGGGGGDMMGDIMKMAMTVLPMFLSSGGQVRRTDKLHNRLMGHLYDGSDSLNALPNMIKKDHRKGYASGGGIGDMLSGLIGGNGALTGLGGLMSNPGMFGGIIPMMMGKSNPGVFGGLLPQMMGMGQGPKKDDKKESQGSFSFWDQLPGFADGGSTTPNKVPDILLPIIKELAINSDGSLYQPHPKTHLRDALKIIRKRADGFADGGSTDWFNETVEPYENNQPLNLSPWDFDRAVRAASTEAGNQGPLGQRAVADVIKNRARQSGSSLHDVVEAPYQFEGATTPQFEGMDTNSPEYQSAADNIFPTLVGDLPDSTGGADHFYAPKAQAALGREPPSWAQGQDPSAVIGDHTFFNLGDQGTYPETSLASADGVEDDGEDTEPDYDADDSGIDLSSLGGSSTQSKSNPWLPVLAAGLGMLGGNSPNAASNIGKGGLAGLEMWQKQKALDVANERTDRASQLNVMKLLQKAQTDAVKNKAYDRRTDLQYGNKGKESRSPAGNIESDYKAGIIDKDTRDASIKKLSQGKGLVPKPQGKLAVGAAISNFEDLKKQAEEIRDDKGLWEATGTPGSINDAVESTPIIGKSLVAGSPYTNVKAKLQTLKSKVGFTVLQLMRDASKTGGAVGNVSDKEQEYLQQNWAALDRAQTMKQFQEQLNKIITYSESAAERIKRAYQETYDEEYSGSEDVSKTQKGTTSGGVNWSLGQ